eukprot:254875-Rhodomonas_salina.1
MVVPGPAGSTEPREFLRYGPTRVVREHPNYLDKRLPIPAEEVDLDAMEDARFDERTALEAIHGPLPYLPTHTPCHPYAHPMQSLVLTEWSLRTPYAKSGTDCAEGALHLLAPN